MLRQPPTPTRPDPLFPYLSRVRSGAYTRHPNNFVEAWMWWAYFFLALVHPWGLLASIGPAYVTWFMGWGSATPGNERHMRKSRGQAFDDYARRVPMFFPRLWPRR